MATNQTIALLMAEISTLYPALFPVTRETAAIWRSYLEDIPDDLLMNALRHYIATAKDNYPPSVPALRRAAGDLQARAAGLPTSAEAWGAIMDSFRRTSFHQPELLENPIVKQAIRCMGGLSVIGMSENLPAERARFLQFYDELRDRALSDAAELPQVTAYVDAKRLEVSGQVKALSDKLAHPKLAERITK